MSINKILFGAQLSEYNKCLLQNQTQMPLHKIIQFQHPQHHHIYSLQNNHFLALVPSRYKNTLATTEHTYQGSYFPRSTISYLTLKNQRLTTDLNKLLKNRTQKVSVLKTIIFLAHDEPTD